MLIGNILRPLYCFAQAAVVAIGLGLQGRLQVIVVHDAVAVGKYQAGGGHQCNGPGFSAATGYFRPSELMAGLS